MATNASPSEERERTICFVNRVIETLNIAKEISSAAPAKAVFGSASALLGTIKDSVVDERGYIELGLSCADVCKALERGLEGRQVDELSESTLGAIEKLTTTLAKIQKIIEQGKRNQLSRLFHAMGDKDAITGWKKDLHAILLTFNTELSMNNYMVLLDLYRKSLAGQEPTVSQQQPTTASIPHGGLPPPPPTACFGRDELIEKIISVARGLSSIALTGAGGIGKTTIALTVLHHGRIRDRFGDNRHFICCNQFPPSHTNFLNKLSKAIAAGVDNPEDLTPLRPSLSSKEIFLILDGAECILDPRGVDGRDTYALVEELSLFRNICLVITSRITTIPPDCKLLEVRELMIDDARRTFHRIYDNDEEPEVIDNILRHLNFCPFSVTLSATVAHQNNWDNSRLAREREQCQTSVLRTKRRTHVAAAIELSLTSPTFQKIGPEARRLLEVIAFFPQGVSEDKIEWLFPTISHRDAIFDRFCTLSLTYRTNGFTTMLTPLRDHLRPEDPTQSPLLCAVKKLYFTRLSVDVDPDYPGFDDSRWIMSEDANVEHLLDVFTSIDSNSDDVWKACAYFMEHLYWHGPRQVVIGRRIKQLPDNRLSKPQCLFQLSRLYQSVGDQREGNELVSYALKLYRKRGNDNRIAAALCVLSDTNRMLCRYEEGVKQAREALEITERIGDTVGQAKCLIALAQSLYDDKQLDAAEEAASRAINLISGKSTEFLLCQSHRLLGDIFHSNGDGEKAVHQYKEAIRIASPPGWKIQLFWAHFSLAQLSLEEEKLNDAHSHIEHAKLHTADDGYLVGRAAEMHGRIWHHQNRFEDATSETSCAMESFTKVGLAEDVARCKTFLRDIEWATSPREGPLPL